MGGEQFDRIAKVLGNGASRRWVLGGLPAGMGSSAFFSPPNAALARRCPKGQLPCGNDDACFNPETQCCKRCPGGNATVYTFADWYPGFSCDDILCGRID